jgi:hypothetical protein
LNASWWKCSSFAISFILNDDCNVQHKSDKARAFKRKQGTIEGVDLMNVDIPKGLPVSMVSSPPTSVLEWNSDDKNFLAMVFDFGGSFVHDNGVLLLFHKDDLKLRADIRGSTKAYHFKILKEWTGINHLPFTSARDASKTVSDSCFVTLFIVLCPSIVDFYLVDHILCFIHL